MKIIEVVGLAGSGKSTLTTRLINNLSDSHGIYRLRKKKWSLIILRSFFSNFMVLLKNIVRSTYRNPIIPLLHFDASIQDIRSLKQEKEGVLILDQGPIFNFISMNRYEFHGLDCAKQQQVLKEKLLDFGKVLDGVIFLHAPLDKLIERVSKREVNHRLKALNDEKRIEFLNHYYSDYTDIIKELSKSSGTIILEIDSDVNDVDKTFTLANNFIASII